MRHEIDALQNLHHGLVILVMLRMSQSYLLFILARPTGNKLVCRWKFSLRVLKIAQRVRVELHDDRIGITEQKATVRSAICAGVTAIYLRNWPSVLTVLHTAWEDTVPGCVTEIMWNYWPNVIRIVFFFQSRTYWSRHTWIILQVTKPCLGKRRRCSRNFDI